MNRIRLGLIGLGEWPRQSYVPVLKVSGKRKNMRSCRQVHPRPSNMQGNSLANKWLSIPTIAICFQDKAIEGRDTCLYPIGCMRRPWTAAAASGKHLFYEPPIAHDAETIVRHPRRYDGSFELCDPARS